VRSISVVRGLRETDSGRVLLGEACSGRTTPRVVDAPRTGAARHPARDAGQPAESGLMSAAVQARSMQAEARSPAVECHDVTVRFNSERRTVTALERISLAVPKGNLLTLLGPSGCGKSTLLRVIADIVQPTSGSVRQRARAGRDASGRHRLRVPGCRIAAVAPRNRQCSVAAGSGRAARAAAGRYGSGGVAGAGRPDKLGESATARTLRRHASARVDRAGVARRTARAADGRTVR
jgi:hypothetical protein